jgi:hypothetical protein
MVKKDEFELYENGKHRRYGLLFSVNGGAFAVAKLLTGECKTTPVVLGDLVLWQLALGMVLFTAVMTYDIYKFGEKMQKKEYLGDEAFQRPGKFVLISLGFLLCVGWALVALPRAWFA